MSSVKLKVHPNMRKQYLAAGLVVVVGIAAITIYNLVFQTKKPCPLQIPDIQTALSCSSISEDEGLTSLLQSLWKRVETGCEDPESETCCREEGSVTDFAFVGDTLSFSYNNSNFCKGNARPEISGESSFIWNLATHSELKMENEIDVAAISAHFWQAVDPQSEINYPPGKDNDGCLEESEAAQFTMEIRAGGLNGGTEGPFFRFGKNERGPYLQMSFHPSVDAARGCALKLNFDFESLRPFLKDGHSLETWVFRQ